MAQGSTPSAACRGLDIIRGGADNLLTVREVAERLGVSPATVYKLCDRGELAHARVSNAIRVTPGDLTDFIARTRRAGRPKR